MADGVPTEISIDSAPKVVRTWEETGKHMDFNNMRSWPNLGRGVSVEQCLKATWDNQELVVYKQFKSGGDGAWGLSNAKESVENLGDLQGGILPKTYALLEDQKAVVQEYVEPREGFRDKIAGFVGFGRKEQLSGQADQKQSAEITAEWVKGYLSALILLHQRGYFLNDLKPEDIVLTQDGRVVFIDVGNMRREGDIVADRELQLSARDLLMFGNLLFSLTEAAKKNGKGLTPSGGAGGKFNEGPPSNRDMIKPIEMARADQAPESLIKVLEAIQVTLGKSNQDIRTHNLEGNIQLALDNYFQELGLFGQNPEQTPAQVANMEVGSPLQRQEGLLPDDKDILDKALDFYGANEPKLLRDPHDGGRLIDKISKIKIIEDPPQKANVKKDYLRLAMEAKLAAEYTKDYPGLDQETESIYAELVKDNEFRTAQWQNYEASLPSELQEFIAKNQQQLLQNPEYTQLMWEVIRDQITQRRIDAFGYFGRQQVQLEPFKQQIRARLNDNLNAIGKIRTQLGYVRYH